MAPPVIVATEMACYDRPSFEDWWPRHLASVLELADRLYLRVDPPTSGRVLAILSKFVADHHIGRDRIVVDPQHSHFGRWQEDAERDAMLAWALEQGADWCAVFDADEVIEPGGPGALQELLASELAQHFRVVGVDLSYSSHHRPRLVLPPCNVRPWRLFRLDQTAATWRFRSDVDGLHCGSVPSPTVGTVRVPELRVIHYHATSPAEYMAERAFYDSTVEVETNGGIDWLYRCDRFGEERLAAPLDEVLRDRDVRHARIAAGEGLIR